MEVANGRTNARVSRKQMKRRAQKLNRRMWAGNSFATVGDGHGSRWERLDLKSSRSGWDDLLGI
jgi:hypothetical protein